MRMRKLPLVFLLVLWLMLIPVKAFADHSEVDRVVDNANLLSDSDYQYITEMLKALSENNDLDIVVFTESEISDEYKAEYGNDYPKYFCADLFDYGGYTDDGLALLIDVNDRKWALVTEGRGDKIFNDPVQKRISDGMVEYLKRDEFTAAINYYAMAVGTELEDDSAMEIADEAIVDTTEYEESVDYEFTTAERIRMWFITLGYKIGLINYPIFLGGSALIALLFAAIRTGIAKASLKSVGSNDYATNYVVGNSLVLKADYDIYLYTETEREEHHESSDSDSSSFVSSSGDEHTGSSGDF